MTELARRAVSVATDQIGRGEQHRNNDGEWVRTYTGGRRGNWCAAFLSWCFELAAEQLGTQAPKRSHGAKRFCRNVADVGHFVDTDTDAPQPGDVISWNRGRLPWMGHVGVVYGYLLSTDTLLTVEGNSGPFPAKVKIRVYPNGAWRKKLYRVARLLDQRR